MESSLERCIRAAKAAAAACQMALEGNVAYADPRVEPPMKAQLALISCASACSVLVRALREGDVDGEVLHCCAEICLQCAGGEPPRGMSPAAWAVVASACARSADACRSLLDGMRSVDLQAFRASHDTDFHAPVA